MNGQLLTSFPRGVRTELINPNPAAWHLLIITTGGTTLEFDVIPGACITITAGPDLKDVQLNAGAFNQPPRPVG